MHAKINSKLRQRGVNKYHENMSMRMGIQWINNLYTVNIYDNTPKMKYNHILYCMKYERDFRKKICNIHKNIKKSTYITMAQCQNN